MKVGEAIRRIFFPRDITCIVCGNELQEQTRYGVCSCCQLPYNTKFCLRCGRNVGAMTAYCLDCMNYEKSFDLARSAMIYTDSVIGLIYKLKYGDGRYLASYMAEYMYNTYLSGAERVDVVTFVPMPPKRRKKRGYNQAELLAKAFCKLSGLPCENLLERVKETKNLARMSRAERREAIIDSFVLTQGMAEEVKNKRVLLIDDVITSGATSNECARVLKKAKAQSVYVMTFASAKERPVLY